MTTIQNYSLFSAKTRLDKPIADATHSLTAISFIVLRISLKNGTTGESYLLSFQYSPCAIAGALKDAGELLIGCDVNDTIGVLEKLNAANEYFGQEGVNRWAQSAFNIAMWDAWCKTLEQPIWKVLGGRAKQIPIYGSG